MPDRTDHERILLMEQACAMNQKNYSDKLDDLIKTVKDSLMDFKKELSEHRDFLNNGISTKIANQIKAEVNKEVIADIVKEVMDQRQANRSSDARTRRSDQAVTNFRNKNIMQKISIIISILVGFLTLSGAIGAGMVWFGNFLMHVAGLK